MDEKRQIICNSCRKSISVDDIKYISRPGGIVVPLCSVCRIQEKGFDPKEVMKEKHVVRESSVKITKPQAKVPYFCYRCKYKFEHNPKSIAALKCPYCGKNDKIEERYTQSTENLVRKS